MIIKKAEKKDEKHFKLFRDVGDKYFHTILSLFLLYLILSIFAKISIN
jgi:hypothetical protein